MSLIFCSLRERGELAYQKIIVTDIHTVTFTCLSPLLALVRQTSSKLSLSGVASYLVFKCFPAQCYLRNCQICISNTSVKV